MIVPDISPLGGSYSPGGYHHRTMISIMEQGNKYRAFLGRSPTPYLRSPPPPQPHPIPPPHLLIGHDPHIMQTDLPVNRDSDLSLSTISSPGTSKMDMSVSPSSSDVGPGWSPSSEKSHLLASSEDGDGTNGEGDAGNSDRKSFKCPQCLYYTDRKNNLKRHIVTMHQECSKTLECCGVMFHSKAALRDHIALFHRGGYRCQICNRNFCRKALLRRHLTVHSGRKDFSCQMCGYATSHKSNLERHQRVHLRRPVCTTMMEACGIPVVHEAENNNTDTVLDIKPKSHREKPSNRFVLLPNRIKCTHRTTADSTSSSNQHWQKDRNSDSPKIKAFSENIFETVGRECSIGSSHSLSDKETLTTITYDNENVQTELSGSEGNTDCHGFFSHAKHTRIFSKRRICVTPYKCSDCGNVFSKQGEFHEHACRRLRGISNTGLSLITAVRKGKIRLMSQQNDYDNSKSDSDGPVTS